MQKINLLVLFTFGISVKNWKEIGLLERELKLYKELSNDIANITFLTYGDKEDLTLQNHCLPVKILPVYSRLKKPKWKWLAFVQSLLIPLYFSQEFRIAHILKTNQMYGSWVGVIGSMIFGKKLIVRCGYEKLLIAINENRNKLNLFLNYIYEYVPFRAADKIVFSSRVSSDFVKRYFKFINNQNKLAVVPNYIDIEKFRPLQTANSKPDSGSGTEGISPKHLKSLLYVGRISSEKNLISVVKAIADTGIDLYIAGDGNKKDEVLALAKSLNVTVHLYGIVPNSELPEILNSHPVFILPSLYENHPKSLLEAMSCGMVVIGTDVEGIRDIINNNINGLLCSTTPESIRTTVKNVFADLSNLTDIRAEARKYVINHCSLGSIVHKESVIYDQVL